MAEEFNFKSFKKRTSYYHRCDFTNEVREWFEGFEKQETKSLEEAKIALETARQFQSNYFETFWLGYIKAKEEILGE